MGGFSFASVILSYFLVAGGLLTGRLAIGYIKSTSEFVAYALFAVGAFIGGFVAGRASRGSTIIEPAIGALLLIATIVLMVGGTSIGKLMWHASSDGVTKFVVAIAACSAVGALGGAFVSEKFFGDATESSLPWIIYASFSTFGACYIATFIAAIIAVGGGSDDAAKSVDTIAKMTLAGVGIGCLLAGLAIGASARTRALGASFLGGGVGVAGFFLLVTKDTVGHDKDAAAGIAVLAIGGAILTLLGSAIGWAAVGKRNAA
jgi:hypothetical protein